MVSAFPKLRLFVTLAFLLAAAGLAHVPGSNAATGDCRVSPQEVNGEATPFIGVCDYLSTREGVVQVAIFDNVTGETHLLDTGDDIQYTASIVKVNVLARWLNSFQRQGVKIPSGIPYSIRYLFGRMIQNSDNAATTGLFYFGGGCDSLSRFNLMIPLSDTKIGCESDSYYGWGNTKTTASDQVKLMNAYAYGTAPAVVPQRAKKAKKKAIRKCRRLDRPARRKACAERAHKKIKRLKKRPILDRSAREYGLSLMQGVEPDQRFGITCGPWGTSCDPPNYANPDPAVTVSLKNGWKTLPTCSDPIPQCPWQVNSTGWVRGDGRDYTLSVLTTKDPVGTGDTFGFAYGIDTIQGISKLAWANLAP